VCLPLLIFPCTIKSRRSLLAPAHHGSPGKRAVKRLWWYGGGYYMADRIIIKIISHSIYWFLISNAFSAFTVLVGRQKEHASC